MQIRREAARVVASSVETNVRVVVDGEEKQDSVSHLCFKMLTMMHMICIQARGKEIRLYNLSKSN